jgi:hypothetical protein
MGDHIFRRGSQPGVTTSNAEVVGMVRLITKERAFALASQWGSFINAGDPGSCMYAFHFNDGRPVDEAHRAECLKWLRSRRGDTIQDQAELQMLICFMSNTELRPA